MRNASVPNEGMEWGGHRSSLGPSLSSEVDFIRDVDPTLTLCKKGDP